MNKAAPIAALVAGCGLLLASSLAVHQSVVDAKERLEGKAPAITKEEKVAIADDAEEEYCTPAFKEVLARVIHACGLVGDEATRRGCQPADVRTLAAISDDDFNALFTPLQKRGAVVMFDDNSETLDDKGQKIVEERFRKRKGARYFFVVARASKTGGADYNRALSHRRANSVMLFLEDTFEDADLDKEVGLLWLGNEFAQLGKEYCAWDVSRPGQCNEEAINRSAFISWVDCRL